jgi:hypothetical protein
MNWKSYLKKLESEKKWDDAIEFMEGIIKENSNNMDAYIFMNFLLVNLIIEEYYDKSKEDRYRTLAKWYFDESYEKFSNNPEYLYITGKTAVMGEWLFGLEQKDYEEMIEKASQLDPNNILYKENYYYNLKKKDPKNPKLLAYAKMILSENSPIQQQLRDKGSAGEYILGLKEGWSEGILRRAQNT